MLKNNNLVSYQKRKTFLDDKESQLNRQLDMSASEKGFGKTPSQSDCPKSEQSLSESKKIKVTTEEQDESGSFHSSVSSKLHRNYGPPQDWSGPPPPRGSEVFVAKLPRDLFEDELIPILEKAGKIYEMRLMMDPLGYNRGYAYVRYASACEAQEAVNHLNHYEVRENHFIGVMKSVDNNRLFVGGIPKTRKQEELFSEMVRLTEGVNSVILYTDVTDKTKNRGFAFIEYRSHRHAALARQKMMKSPPLLWGTHQVKIDWAEPELEVDDETMKKVKILYVRNLSLTTSEQQLQDLFTSLGGQIDRVRKLKDYAFVHFATREQAEKAKSHFQGHVMDGCEMDISWSKPVTNREEYQQRKAMSKFMLSSRAGSSPSPAIATAINVQGEPIFLNPRVRNAAGSQGFTSQKSFVGQAKRPEIFLPKIPSQPNILVPAQYYSAVNPVKTPVEQFGVTPNIQPIYALERTTSSEDIPSQDDIQMHLATPLAPQYGTPAAQWAQMPLMLPQQLVYSSYGNLPQVAGHANLPAPTPYYYQQPTVQQAMLNGNQFGHLPYTQFIQSPMMTHITNISASTMSIDRP